ncbi:MAG TPA: cytochrome c oxidase subunit II [Steroidobacteraceae bacterium]|nr:cytochrome c oxidase subunit II [Steroidobacteraceae bacterium]
MNTPARLRAWLFTGAVLALAACDGPQSALLPRAEQAEAIDRVWRVMLWTCTALYIVVLLALAYAMLRRRADRRREGIASDPLLRKTLAAWVVVIVAFLTAFVALSYAEDRRIRGGEPDLEVRITAKQWWWQVEYLDADPSRQFTTANELHLPRDRTARIELRAGDVIHSYWVPALGGKEDLIPGRTNAVWVTPRENGTWRGQCAEFCGLQHAHMALDVFVHDVGFFERWRDTQLYPARLPETATARRGKAVFEQHACATCHTVRGTTAGGRLGPDLTHFASRRHLAAGLLPVESPHLLAWIEDPQRLKPGAQMPAVPLAPQDLLAVNEYLLGLR